MQHRSARTAHSCLCWTTADAADFPYAVGKKHIHLLISIKIVKRKTEEAIPPFCVYALCYIGGLRLIDTYRLAW